MSTWFVLTDFSPLGRVTVEHLHNVFTCTAVSMFCAYIASYFHVMDFTTKQAHLSTFSSFPFGRNGVVLIINPIYEPPFYSSLSMFYAMIFVCYGYLTRRSTNIQRFSVVILMSFICGFGFRPTLGFLEVDHGTTSRVFRSASGGFLLLALGVQYFRRRWSLYLAGFFLMAFPVAISYIGLLDSPVQFYGCGILFYMRVVYDTQLVVGKHRRGQADFIGHSMDLSQNFLVSVYLLAFLRASSLTCMEIISLIASSSSQT